VNFDGFTPYPIERFSSLVEMDDPTNLPLGVCPIARNVSYRLTRVMTRAGIQNSYGFVLPDGGPATGIASLELSGNPDTQIPAAFSGLGNLYIESPAGSRRVKQISSPQVPLPVGASMQAAAAYQKGYLAFGDLKQSLASPAVLNLLTMNLDPLSTLPVGQSWAPLTNYVVGNVVTPATPVGGNGHSYICTVAGQSGPNQPAFPLTEQGVIADGGVTWRENTPVMAQAIPEPPIPTVARSAGAGTFAAGRDVYILVTLVNGNGETDAQTVLAFKFINTTLNDRFIVTSPTLALWVQALPAPYAVTGYNVYEADVATGGGAPAIAAYKKVNGGAVAIGVNTNVDTTGAGVAPPTTNGAVIVPIGNICAGLRYLVIMYINRNGYISGMTQASAILYNSSTNGFQLYVAHIPVGPPNTAARLCAFTPAGALSQLAGYGISSAGPYFWIAPNFPNGIFDLTTIGGGVTIGSVVNGVSMTSTLINDNVTTSATFNFTDDFLKSTLNDVSAYFRKILVPPCSDVYYSKTLKRMLYAADNLPSGWYVSLPNDPESVYGDAGGIVQVAENTGERRTAVREFGGVVYLMKERSGHVLTPSPDDPSKWIAVEQWGGDKGSGPCGPRAVDVCTNFMCYIHRSGVYIFEGGQPYRISKEVPITWSQINWAVQQTFWVMIDDETREIRIGVAYGQSTVPNIVLKCNYEELPSWSPPSFAPPIHFSPYMGKEIAAGGCYKWSVDDIAANVCIRAERQLVPPAGGFPLGFDLPTIQSQILFGSSNADGAVAAIVPGTLDDNGAGIDSQVETACPVIMNGDGKIVKSLMGPSRLGGVQLNIDGVGRGGVFVLALRAKDPKQGGPPLAGKSKANVGSEIRLKKPWIAGIPYSCGGMMTNERMRLRITNDKMPGNGFDLKWAAIFAQPITTARPS
jgi:hypothetical protein